jgi:hypothetical protein
MKRTFEARLLIDAIQPSRLSGKHAVDATNPRVHSYTKLLAAQLAARRSWLPGG